MPSLNVPLIPQWGIGANFRRNDCGVACVAMLLSYYGKLDGLSVDALTRQTGLAASDSGLYPVQLAVLGAQHDLPLAVHSGTTLDAIRGEIDAGRPVIALVAYRYILGRLDQADNVPGKDGHFLVILGYDDTHVVANDPDTWINYEQYGHNDLIPITEMERAIAGASYHNQCVFVGEVTMTPLEQAKALTAQLSSVLQTIPEAMAGPVTKYATVDQLNVRGGAGTNYPILRKLALGEEVSVTASAGQWDTISAPVAGFVYNPSLSVTRPT